MSIPVLIYWILAAVMFVGIPIVGIIDYRAGRRRRAEREQREAEKEARFAEAEKEREAYIPLSPEKIEAMRERLTALFEELAVRASASTLPRMDTDPIAAAEAANTKHATDNGYDRYRKLPVEIEARRWPGTAEKATPIIDWILAGDGNASYYGKGEIDADMHAETIAIRTLEGTMHASPGDWIIKGVNGEFYPCKPDIFEATYLVVS